MKPIEAIIRSLRVAMTDARQNESLFESWMILNEAICDAIDALAEQPAQPSATYTCGVCGVSMQMEQPQQDPVAWRTFDGEGGYDYRTYDENEKYAEEWAQRNPRHVGWVEPLYTSPPSLSLAQRTWVGLTPEELDEMFSKTLKGKKLVNWVARAIEAKLKEKNHD